MLFNFIAIATIVVFVALPVSFICFRTGDTKKHELIGTRWILKDSNPFDRLVYVVNDVKEDWVSAEASSNGYKIPKTMPISILKSQYRKV